MLLFLSFFTFTNVFFYFLNVEFPWRRSRRLTSQAAVEFFQRRRILSLVFRRFDGITEKLPYLNAVSTYVAENSIIMIFCIVCYAI